MDIDPIVLTVGWLVVSLVAGLTGAALGVVVIRRNRRSSRLL